MTQPKTRMVVRSIKSVGLVDAGACEGADIVLFKRGESLNSMMKAASLAANQAGVVFKTDDVAETFSQIVGEREVDSQLYQATDALRESLCSIACDTTATDKVALTQQSIAQFASVVTGIINGALMKRGAKMATERQAKFKAALDQLMSIFDEVANGGDMAKQDAEKKDATPAVEPTGEDVQKRLETVEKALADAEKRAADAEIAAKAATDAAATEKAARLTTEFVQKARELNIAGTKPEDFGLVLKSIHSALPAETAAEIERIFKALSAQVAAGELFAEKGKTDSADSASAKIEILAKELLSKGEAKTIAVARVEVRKRNPELANQEKAARA